MDNEKDLLKNDLSKLETKKDVEQFVEDAKLLGYEDIAELGKQKLKEISNKAESIEKTSESKISQINELGGSKEELQERTQEIDKEIKNIPEEATEKIKEANGSGIIVETEINEKTPTEEFDTFFETDSALNTLMNNVDVFKKFKEKVGSEYIASKLLEKKRGDLVAKLNALHAFGDDLAINTLAPKIIEQGWEYSLINSLNTYSSLGQEEIARALINKGKSNLIKQNIEKFTRISEDLKKQIIS